MINLRRDPLSVKDSLFLYLLIELFTTFSKSSNINVADGDPCIREPVLEEMSLLGCKHTADSGTIFIAHDFIT
jgi:hypothetical protein